MTTQRGDSERTIFGIANAISRELMDEYPGCAFGYICDPPNHIAVMIMGSDIKVLNLLYLFWTLAAPRTETEMSKPELLTHEAKSMADDIESIIKSYGGQNLDTEIQGKGKPRFWYSGPFFDNDLLREDAWAEGAGLGMPRDIVDRLWNEDHAMLDRKANNRLSTYSFPYRLRYPRQ